MARFSLSLGRDDKGRPKFEGLNIDLPEEGKINVKMDEKGSITFDWEGDTATVKSVLTFLKENLSNWFPGLNE